MVTWPRDEYQCCRCKEPVSQDKPLLRRSWLDNFRQLLMEYCNKLLHEWLEVWKEGERTNSPFPSKFSRIGCGTALIARVVAMPLTVATHRTHRATLCLTTYKGLARAPIFGIVLALLPARLQVSRIRSGIPVDIRTFLLLRRRTS